MPLESPLEKNCSQEFTGTFAECFPGDYCNYFTVKFPHLLCDRATRLVVKMEAEYSLDCAVEYELLRVSVPKSFVLTEAFAQEILDHF